MKKKECKNKTLPKILRKHLEKDYVFKIYELKFRRKAYKKRL